MPAFRALALVLLAAAPARAADPVDEATTRIVAEITRSTASYANLLELTAIGPRLGGTPAAEKAVDWAVAKLSGYGFDRVWTQPVSVPRWERGAEHAALISRERATPLTITTLGSSVGTDAGPVEAEVVEVRGLAEAEKLGAALAGKIVFFNEPMDPKLPDTFEAYGKAVGQRSRGASLAGRFGAVAALVRSMTTLADDPLPHAGGTWYKDDAPRIPAAALSTRDAARLSTTLKTDPHTRVRLELGAKNLGKADSRNVLAELRGRELPEEIVVVGGHLDSWDLGPGAHDDAAGVVHSIEALRALAALGLRPKRTVRLVLFMSEEVGGVGGREYARQARSSGEKHIAALESDRGGFSPLGFSASTATFAALEGWKPYLAKAHAARLFPGGGGTDVGALEEQGVPAFELVPQSKHYFDYHHSARDTASAVVPRELASGAAATAVFTYLAAELGVPRP